MQQIRTPWTDIAHIKNAVEKVGSLAQGLHPMQLWALGGVAIFDNRGMLGLRGCGARICEKHDSELA